MSNHLYKYHYHLNPHINPHINAQIINILPPLLQSDPSQNFILHRKLDHPLRVDFLPIGKRVLLARGRWREDDHVHKYPIGVGGVPVTGQQDPAAHVHLDPFDRQVPLVHLHHEHLHYIHHGDHNKLELPYAAYPPHVQVGEVDLLELFA